MSVNDSEDIDAVHGFHFRQCVSGATQADSVLSLHEAFEMWTAYTYVALQPVLSHSLLRECKQLAFPLQITWSDTRSEYATL